MTSIFGKMPPRLPICAALAVMAFPLSALGQDPSLTAHYTFDGHANDTTGHGYDGSLIGNVDCNQAGVVGTSCRVGNSGDSIEVSTYPLQQFEPNGFTVATWIQLTNTRDERFELTAWP